MLPQRKGTSITHRPSAGYEFLKVYTKGDIPTLLPWAEYAIISYKSEVLDISMRRVPFDIRALKSVIKQSDLPIKDWWLGQYNQTNKLFHAGNYTEKNKRTAKLNSRQRYIK